MPLTDWLPIALLGALLLLTLWLALRRPDDAALRALQQSLAATNERLERELRDEVARSATATRQELVQTLGDVQRTLLAQQGDAARLQLDQLRALAQATDQRMNEVRQSVEQKLGAIQSDNDRRLEQMRATVDEKLHATLETRLGESFKQVAERLEQVHRGLGEMQTLARDVGSLNRVLTNVKSRGIFGEVQLAGLIEQVFTPEQYATNVATVPNASERVEFAIRLPGQRGDGRPLWLPIDAKFPREDYERLLDAQERGDVAASDAAARAVEGRLRLEARSIRDKYVAPPHTTDFAILFVPIEGLYAEALRRPGLVEALQREYKVVLAGPTTLLATLTSLQMGFRTLALEQRSAEVWEVLGAVKTEFGKFGDVLIRTKKKLEEASSSIEMAERRARVMARELRSVEALPESVAQRMLPLTAADDTVSDAGRPEA